VEKNRSREKRNQVKERQNGRKITREIKGVNIDETMD
jgi:hypothetical protein